MGALFDIATNPLTNELYGVANGNTLALIDTTTGAATAIGPVSSTNLRITGLTFDSDGTLYGSGQSSLFTFDLHTGAASLVGNMGYTSAGDLAFDDTGNLFLSANTGIYDSIVSVDKHTGMGTLLFELGFDQVNGLSFEESRLFGFTLYGETFIIDTDGGWDGLVAMTGLDAFGADAGMMVIPPAVPVPAAVWLFGTGILGLIGYSKRRKTA
jgi:hypothetical protein